MLFTSLDARFVQFMFGPVLLFQCELLEKLQQLLSIQRTCWLLFGLVLAPHRRRHVRIVRIDFIGELL